jgi:hypothetical protein
MSAIRCKIIICGGEVGNAANTAMAVIDDLSQDEKLTKKFVEASEEFVHKMHRINEELTKNA